jgi:hypothetical protein
MLVGLYGSEGDIITENASEPFLDKLTFILCVWDVWSLTGDVHWE